ncbi:MAG: glucosamine-6-phosphate deaminase [Clostridia bacterium]|nr:glucosamine-6-phosphate deaminase [Clostridia bacterium]
MKVILIEDYQTMSKKAANIVESQIILKPHSVLGLATGETVLGMYKEIVKSFENGDLDFSDIKTFNLDEYYGIDKENKRSYYYYMEENLFKHININNANIHIPDGMTSDIEEECKIYEEKIERCGGIDLQILGIGRNGHIGFNEPGCKFEALTHLVHLDKTTIKDNSRFFNSISEVPTKAISMGIKTIMNAKKVILLASGQEKAEALYKALRGNITPKVPASILQLHSDVTVIVDRDGASRL